MDPKVHGGLGVLESRELEQRGANAGERRDVKPYRASVGALKGPQHGLPESNGRAARMRLTQRQMIMLIALGLNPAELAAAVSGEG